jgi:hypothetical protein
VAPTRRRRSGREVPACSRRASSDRSSASESAVEGCEEGIQESILLGIETASLGVSDWACLPAGPLERRQKEGGPGGVWEGVRNGPARRDGYLSWKVGNSGQPLLVTWSDAKPEERLQSQ